MCARIGGSLRISCARLGTSPTPERDPDHMFHFLPKLLSAATLCMAASSCSLITVDSQDGPPGARAEGLVEETASPGRRTGHRRAFVAGADRQLREVGRTCFREVESKLNRPAWRSVLTTHI